jgi:2-keto-3-deoxy-L-rhamnonate aldolase RhmA
VLANCGYDFAILDLEHSGTDLETIRQQIAFARGLSIEVYVRVPENSYAAVARVLDAGAQGVMVPMLETPEQAREVVEWARYRPEGKRGLAFGIGHDGYRGADPVGTMATANERNVLIALIESEKGIENADAILATPGIDIGWLGHFDLTSDMGITAQFDHPRFWAAVEKLAAAGKAHGKACGILDGNVDFLQKFAARGYRALGFATDVAVLRQGYTAGLQQLKSLPTPQP